MRFHWLIRVSSIVLGLVAGILLASKMSSGNAIALSLGVFGTLAVIAPVGLAAFKHRRQRLFPDRRQRVQISVTVLVTMIFGGFASVLGALCAHLADSVTILVAMLSLSTGFLLCLAVIFVAFCKRTARPTYEPRFSTAVSEHGHVELDDGNAEVAPA